ncbi:MAG: thiamine-phosphate kinase [Actinomycetota bacterium]
MNSATIFELGEIESLKRATKFLKPGEFALVGSGDDAAVVRADGSFVVTTDTMVENHDFKTEWSSGFDLGWKAAATNLSDVAAMGARPTALVVAVVATKTTTVAWLEDFARGLQVACDELAPGCGVVGGDLAVGEAVVIAVTAHGQLDGRNPVLRSGAREGDLLAVAGTLGRAAAGLALLSNPDADLRNVYPEITEIQLRPKPPIQLGVAAGLAGATAMLDVSDSLAKDAGRIADASEVTLAISNQKLLGYFAVLEQVAQSITARGSEASEKDWVLFGGEDHSLLCTFPKDAEIPTGFKVIGEVQRRQESPVTLDGLPLETKGWDSVSN